MNNTKVCTKCKKELTINSFSKRSFLKDGINNICKECDRARGREYYKKNKAIVAARHKEYNDTNKEANRERNRDYYLRNKDKVLEVCKEYRRKNHSEVIRRGREKRANLSDGYVKRLLTAQYGLSETPQEFLEAKRMMVLLKRKFKNDY